MKYYIPNTFNKDTTLSGKGKFCRDLGQQMLRLGYKVTDNQNENVDISLNVVSVTHYKSKVRVLRLAGVYHDTKKDYIAKNMGMKNSLDKADGVIYQSNHAMRMCDRYLRIYDGKKLVIYNGANPDLYASIKPVSYDTEYNFITFSKWRPHKRLRDIIESYLLADIRDSKLFILGDVAEKSGLTNEEIIKYSKNKRLVFCGMLPQNKLIPILKACVATIHLCWFDGCPNSAVESIVAGVPVITNNVGGTRELIELTNGGIICDIDEPYDLRPVDLYNPPKIDRGIIAKALRDIIRNKIDINAEPLYIKNTARQYIKFMESCYAK